MRLLMRSQRVFLNSGPYSLKAGVHDAYVSRRSEVSLYMKWTQAFGGTSGGSTTLKPCPGARVKRGVNSAGFGMSFTWISLVTSANEYTVTRAVDSPVFEMSRTSHLPSPGTSTLRTTCVERLTRESRRFCRTRSVATNHSVAPLITSVTQTAMSSKALPSP